MSLQRFKEEVKARGLAKNNRFLVDFRLPNLIQKDMFNLQIIHLFCESTSIPGINIATQPNRTFGEQREIPYDRNFDPVTLNFYVDQAMTVKYFFDTWMNCVINPISRTINYYDNYITDIDITVLDTNDDHIYQITLYEAYPKNIQSIALDQNGRDVMKLAVVFNYKYSSVQMYDTLGGDPNIQNIFNTNKNTPLNGVIPFDYANSGSVWASTVPSEYLQNAISFNEQYADQISAANAIAQIQSQGIQTGLGSLLA